MNTLYPLAFMPTRLIHFYSFCLWGATSSIFLFILMTFYLLEVVWSYLNDWLDC
jgi:hypothetical protein